jgi:hypothetical protein
MSDSIFQIWNNGHTHPDTAGATSIGYRYFPRSMPPGGAGWDPKSMHR